MAKPVRVLIDWKKPIEHVIAGIKVVYKETIKTESEYKFLLISGEDETPMLVDECGCIKAKEPVFKILRIRNVVDKPAEALPFLQPLMDAAPMAELTVAIESLHDLLEQQTPTLRDALVKATAAMVKVAESFSASVADMRKLAAEQQNAYMNASMMLIEELRPKPVAVEAEPAPAARPKPVVLHSVAELGKALTGVAPIKNGHHLETKAERETIDTLSLATGIKCITIGSYGVTAPGKDGFIKYCNEETNGLKAKVWGDRHTHDVYVSCDRADRSAIIGVIEYLGREALGKAL